MLRYVNQTPGTQTFTDHLGNERTVDGRNDVFPHRVIVYLKGWLGTPKLIYTVFLWTVNTTDQDALLAVMGYQFDRKFSLYAGINGTPGTRSMQGSHPLWLGHDRMMADEFFRPYFAFGTWASGEIVPGLWYNAMVGNNSSALGVKAAQLDRDFASGASLWWMPTTREFGPKGAYGDWEYHERLATRVGFSTAQSREQRFTDADTGATGKTVIKLADSLNVFDTGALASGVTVDQVDYRILSFDAGLKYRGNLSDSVTPVVGEPVPIVAIAAFLDHTWNESFSSAIGYSWQENDNTDAQAPDAFRVGHYALGNLLYYPAPNVMIGGELQWGRRENFADGFQSDGFKLQFSFKYNFSVESGG